MTKHINVDETWKPYGAGALAPTSGPFKLQVDHCGRLGSVGKNSMHSQAAVGKINLQLLDVRIHFDGNCYSTILIIARAGSSG